MANIEIGDLLYEYSVAITGVVHFGIELSAILSGESAIPTEGARFDVAIDGESVGPKLKGRVSGIDHLRVRADGRMDLHIHAVMETDDGARISIFADGVCKPEPGSPVAELRENVTLFTSDPRYAWVNPLQIWGVGTVDLAKQVVHIRGFSA